MSFIPSLPLAFLLLCRQHSQLEDYILNILHVSHPRLGLPRTLSRPLAVSVRFHSTSFRGFSEEQGYPIDRGSRLNATEAEEGVEHNTPLPVLHGRRRCSPAQLALHVHFRVTDGGRTEGEADAASFRSFPPSFLPFPFSREIKLRISSLESNRARVLLCFTTVLQLLLLYET